MTGGRTQTNRVLTSLVIIPSLSVYCSFSLFYGRQTPGCEVYMFSLYITRQLNGVVR